MPTRVCPECGEEYIASALTCVHCNVALVGAEAAAPAPSRHELPPASELLLLRTGTLGFAQSLSERLSGAGITHRLEADSTAREGDQETRRPDAMPYGVFVHEHDAAAAREIDREHMRSQFPDFPEEGPSDAVSEGCPACGAAAAPDATECPDCGLALLPA